MKKSYGGSIIFCMSILLFSVFGFLWYCVDVLIYGGTVSLPKHFFSESGDVNVSIFVYLSFDVAYETPADSSIPVTNKYAAQRYLKYGAKLYHNYKSDPNC